MKHSLLLDIQWDSAAGEPLFDRAQLRRWCLATLQQDAQLTFRFVGKKEGRSLNAAHRGKDYATNVLTFEYGDLPDDGGQLRCTADIVICVPVIKKEAREQKKSLLDHMAHMVVHGTLHAQGYDHLEEEEAEIMEALETQVLKRFRIADPYLS